MKRRSGWRTWPVATSSMSVTRRRGSIVPGCCRLRAAAVLIIALDCKHCEPGAPESAPRTSYACAHTWRRAGSTKRCTPRDAWHTAEMACPIQRTSHFSPDDDWGPLGDTGPPASLLSCTPFFQTHPNSVTRLWLWTRLLGDGRMAAYSTMFLAQAGQAAQAVPRQAHWTAPPCGTDLAYLLDSSS